MPSKALVLTFLLTATAFLGQSGCGGRSGQAGKAPAGRVSVKPSVSAETIAEAVRQAALVMKKPDKTDADYSRVIELLAPYGEMEAAPARLFEFLGEANLYLARFEKAEHALAEGLRRDLYSKRIRELISNLNYVRGRLSLEKGVYDRARDFFSKALFNTPNDVDLKRNIGRLYSGEGKKLVSDGLYRKAAVVFADAARLGVAEADDDSLAALALVETGQPGRALATADRYLRNHPDDYRTLIVKARALRALNRIPQAISVARSVLAQDPGNPEATRFLKDIGRVGTGIWIPIDDAIESHNWPRAMRLLEQALKRVTDPSSPVLHDIYVKLADVCSELNDYAKALMYLDMAVAADPDDVELNVRRATLLRRSQRLDEAKKALEGLLVAHPDDPRVRLAMADYWIQLKLPANAIPHLEALASDDSGRVSRELLLKALNQLGYCYAQRKQFDKAEEVWLTIVGMDPGNARVHYNLGYLYQKQSRFGTAMEYYEKACVAADPDDPNLGRYLYALAIAYRQNGQQEAYQATLVRIMTECPLSSSWRRLAYRDLQTLGWKAPWLREEQPSSGQGNAVGFESILAQADGAARTGDLKKAAELYRRIADAAEDRAGTGTTVAGAAVERPSRTVAAAAYRGLGTIAFTKMHYDRAAAAFMKALALVHGDRTSLDWLARTFCALGLYDDAIESYRSLLSILRRRKVSDQRCLLGYARALEGRGRLEEAVQVLDRLVDMEPGSLVAARARRFIDRISPRLLDGEPSPEELSGRQRRQARSYRELALALVDLGLQKEAWKYLERARSLAGDDIETVLAQARLLDGEGRGREALELVESLLQRAPRDTRVLVLQATLMYKNGDVAGAGNVLKQVLEIDPTHFEAAAALADIYQASGRGADARAVLEELLRRGLSPDEAEKAREKLRLLGTM